MPCLFRVPSCDVTIEVDWSCAGCVLEMDRLVRSHLFEHHISANEMVRSAQDTLAKTASRDLGKRNTMQYYVKMMKKINEIGVSRHLSNGLIFRIFFSLLISAGLGNISL